MEPEFKKLRDTTSNKFLKFDDPNVTKFWDDSLKQISSCFPIRIKTNPTKHELKRTKLNSLPFTNSLAKCLDMNHLPCPDVKEFLKDAKVAETMTYVSSDIRSETICLKKRKLFPLWESWLFISIDMYNHGLQLLRANKDISQYDLRNKVKDAFVSDINKYRIPCTCVEYSAFEAFNNFHVFSLTPYKSFYDDTHAISLDGRKIGNGYIYVNSVKEFINKKYQKLKARRRSQIVKNCAIKELNIDTSRVCKLCYNRLEKKFYLMIPHDTVPTNTCTRKFISLDPGIRTFLTYYDGQTVGEIGKNISCKLYRLELQIDKINSKISIARSSTKRKLKIAAARIRTKIKNIVKDLHFKTRKFLRQYEYIILPEFKVKDLISKKSKLRPISKRMISDLSHFTFKMRLAASSSEFSKVLICNEAYTSKTCTRCGFIKNNLGGNKTYKCDACGLVIDRDVNGARNILLRALQYSMSPDMLHIMIPDVEGSLQSFDSAAEKALALANSELNVRTIINF